MKLCGIELINLVKADRVKPQIQLSWVKLERFIRERDLNKRTGVLYLSNGHSWVHLRVGAGVSLSNKFQWHLPALCSVQSPAWLGSTSYRHSVIYVLYQDARKLDCRVQTPVSFRGKKKIEGTFTSVVLTSWIFSVITNSMDYGIRRFNAAFIRALQ